MTFLFFLSLLLSLDYSYKLRMISLAYNSYYFTLDFLFLLKAKAKISKATITTKEYETDHPKYLNTWILIKSKLKANIVIIMVSINKSISDISLSVLTFYFLKGFFFRNIILKIYDHEWKSIYK